jgi:putative tryptophan/tyrosine transport system substrate-binding protein
MGSIWIRRRQFISLIGGAAAWPLYARAQQPAVPVIAFVNGAASDAYPGRAAAFRNGLEESGFVDGQNVTVEYHWLDGRYDRLPALMGDFVRRHVAVIATPVSNPAALAAKAATTTIPIVFGVGDDPVKLGLVDSLSRPGGNATGINIFGVEIVGKRLAFLHELVPNAVRVAVLVHPGNRVSETTAQEAAPAIGMQVQVLKAATICDIDAAFTTIVQERLDALFVAADSFLGSSRVQIVTLAARNKVPATYADRESVEAGGLMSYSVNVASAFRQVGVYVGKILKGTKPADLPVVQPTNFELAVNLQTAKTLGITVPNTLLALADEVIE